MISNSTEIAGKTSTGKSAPAAQLVLANSDLRTWANGSRLEWIVTNGIGGYASGTLAGANTRRYHAFLMAALDPPLGRTLFVPRIQEVARIDGVSYPLSSNQWWDGSISPLGFEQLDSFRLEDGLPVFVYRLGDVLMEKRVWMESGENVTWAAYTWPEGAPEARISVQVFLGRRDYHGSQHGSSDWHWRMSILPDGFWAGPGENDALTFVRASGFRCFVPESQWYWGYLRARERERGLDDTEDYWCAGTLELELAPGKTVGLMASAGDSPLRGADLSSALQREQARRAHLLDLAPAPPGAGVEACLALTAETFLVRRPVAGGPLPAKPNTIVAGYHWFGDWGRDTMISLPGLTLTTGRLDEARGILSAYASLIDGGMIPNRFPDAGGIPDYNTVDATLWYFQAIRHYLQATEDRDLLTELYPRLQQIIDCHLNGTRHGIRVDPRDGLLCSGEGLSQLTWMDARVGDWVVTPRHGKPVEIQALWYNALRCMAEWAILCGDDGRRYGEIAGRTAASFLKRFPVPESGYLYDVVDTGHGDDASFRPNQLFAAGLPYPLLPVDVARSVVNECEKRLLTPAGLRTLDPADPGYKGIYEGDQWRRDGAYHQGTVWAWLIGPYVDAVLYAFDDRERARRALDPLLAQVETAGVGTISEIFDGDAPHLPRGCISQAWSVAEVLRALARIKEQVCDC